MVEIYLFFFFIKGAWYTCKALRIFNCHWLLKVLTLITRLSLMFPLWIIFDSLADGCYNYTNLTESKRKSDYKTTDNDNFCDSELIKGWYRFLGGAGTKMPTTRVPPFRCGTTWSGWLDGAHPTVEDGKVKREVCFSDRKTGCTGKKNIFVKNCGSFYIYFLYETSCPWRYCGTNSWGAKKLEKKKKFNVMNLWIPL